MWVRPLWFTQPYLNTCTGKQKPTGQVKSNKNAQNQPPGGTQNPVHLQVRRLQPTFSCPGPEHVRAPWGHLPQGAVGSGGGGAQIMQQDGGASKMTIPCPPWASPSPPLVQGPSALLQSVPLDLANHFRAPAFPAMPAFASASSGHSLLPPAPLRLCSPQVWWGWTQSSWPAEDQALELSPRPRECLVSALGTHPTPPPWAGLPDQTRTLLRWHQLLDPGLCPCHQRPSTQTSYFSPEMSGQGALGSTSTRSQTLSRSSHSRDLKINK